MQKVKEEKDVILFDLDGTLTDPGEGITKSVNYALEAFGIHTKNLDDLYKFIGPPLMESFMEFYGFDKEQARKGVDKYREYFRDSGIYENKKYEGIDELLRKLKEEGRQLILATSKPRIFAEVILEHFGLAKYFSCVCGSELDGTRDRKGEVIRFALEAAGIMELNRVVMVGDRKHDVLGAIEAGVDCIGVTYGYGSREELENAGASFIADSVEELGRLLLKGGTV